MAGYKQSILDHEPKLFITFDGVFFDPGTRRLIDESPPIIMDESGEGNNGTLILDNPSWVSYRMGDASLVDLEPEENYSMTVGEYVPIAAHPSLWAKNYITIPHSGSFTFPNLGSYSLGFLYRKNQRDTNFRDWYKEEYGSYDVGTINPIIRKGLVLSIQAEESFGFGPNYTRLRFSYLNNPNGLTQTEFKYGITLEQMQKYNHFFMTWDVKPTTGALYAGTMTIYHNARIIHQQTYNYFSAPPTTNVSSPWELFGHGGAPGITFVDRCKSPITLDQVSVFNKALSEDEISTLFKKTRDYKNFVVSQNPQRFYPMEDLDQPGITTMLNIMPENIDGNGINLDGIYYGISEGKVVRRFNGPNNIPESYSVLFEDDGMARIEKRFGAAMQAYTVDGWFNSSHVKRGLLIGQASETRPYFGWNLFLNQTDGVETFGRIQLTVAENMIVNSRQFRDDGFTPIHFNDGQWHYFVIRRKDGYVELWLDGVKHGQVEVSSQIMTGDDKGINLMGMDPGDMWTEGRLSLISMYNYALSEANIRARYNYGTTWRIRGEVTLQGVPFAATLRAYKHLTGELVQEITSDPGTGNYIIRLYDNSFIDLMAFSKTDPNVRFRSFGPISPTIEDDQPTS